MAGTSQIFVVEHEFSIPANMQYGKMHYGGKTKHCDCSWRICVYRDKGKLMYGLECLKNNNDWIKAIIDCKLTTSTGCLTENNEHWFKYDNYWKTAKWNQLRKDIMKDGKMKLEFLVQIKSIIKTPDDQSSSNSSSDTITLVFSGRQQIVIAKELLFNESKYFKSLISRNQKQKVINLQDTGIEFVLDLVDVLKKKVAISDEIVSAVLAAAFDFRFENIVKKCEQFLKENSKKSRLEKLEIASRFELHQLKDHLNRIEKSELCLVSTDSLRCGICYEIFDGTPQTLECGHTFCSTCLATMIANRHPHKTLNCPMCRKQVDTAKNAPNYTLKSILEGLEEISKKEEKKASNSTMNTINSLLRKQCEVAEKQLDSLRVTEYKKFKNVHTEKMWLQGGNVIYETEIKVDFNEFPFYLASFSFACGFALCYWFTRK